MRKFFRHLFELLFPPRCCFCRSFLRRGEDSLCAVCEQSLPRTGEEDARRETLGFSCAAPLYYEGRVRKSFHRFKFQGAVNYAKPYGRLMAECFQAHPLDYDIITWVPVSARRRRKRGYDQSMLLAYALALGLDDVAVETLSKPQDTKAQTELSGVRARRENVTGAFQVTDPELIAGRRVLLVDDILTTGATFSECANTLLKAGASEVSGLVFARVRQEK